MKCRKLPSTSVKILAYTSCIYQGAILRMSLTYIYVNRFDLEDVKNVGLFQKWCVIPVLGLIENSLYDNVLLHNCFCLLLQIINSCSKVADLLLDNGLLYVLCNTLAALNGLETK